MASVTLRRRENEFGRKRELTSAYKNYFDVKRAIYMLDYTEPIIYPIFLFLYFIKVTLFYPFIK